MHFHILSLFPDLLQPYFSASILGKAQEAGLIQIHCHQLRDYAQNKHQSVDDRPYGGGSGMVFRPEVVVEAVEALKQKYSIQHVILTSPRGKVFSASVAKQFTQYQSILIICGRYEGIDQRAIDLVVDEEISMGDFVITGGELAAQMMVDAAARFIPGVLGDETGALTDSHENQLLEYPHYTRPAEYRGLKVPEVLISGNHQAIEEWRVEQAKEITQKRRPDLLKK